MPPNWQHQSWAVMILVWMHREHPGAHLQSYRHQTLPLEEEREQHMAKCSMNPFNSLFTLPYSHSCTCKTVGHTHSVLPRHRNPLYTKPFFKRALLNVLYHGPFQSGHKCQWSPGSRQAWRSDPAALGWPGWEEWGGTCPGEGPEVQVVHGEQSCEELSWDGSVKGMLWEGSKHEDSWWRFRKRQKEKKKMIHVSIRIQ